MGCSCLSKSAELKKGGPTLLRNQVSKKPSQESREQGVLETFAVLRVIKAELNRSFDSYGRMDPFAVVDWITEDGVEKEISRTRTDWNAHFTPHWDHTCRGQPFSRTSKDMVEFQVMEGNVIGRDTFCGSARVIVRDLLGERLSAAISSQDSATAAGSISGPVVDLSLKNEGEVTGVVTVQALIVSRTQEEASGLCREFTKAEPSMFAAPVQRLGVSGGSAPFFKLELQSPHAQQAVDHFIGKDLSHAEDEVWFYEEVLSLLRKPGAQGLAPLLGFTFEYAGVLRSFEEPNAGSRRENELLVMRNLRSGCAQLRMLDIKIGQKTAQAGWQGKSRSAALRQSLVDGITNSSCEGFRLEGFDGRPPALSSMDPLLDLGMTGNAKMSKKALRVMLQRMTGAEMLIHFLDVHQEPLGLSEGILQDKLSPTEVAELVAHEVVGRLAQLAIACRRSPVPQKWIGSSVGLAFDAGQLPARGGGEEEVRKSTMVNIFDWGRSELNTLDKHLKLSEKDQHDRGEFWRYYMGGIDRLAWEAARAYRHRFCCVSSWSHATFQISDFDSMSENDFIGRLTVPVEETPETSAELITQTGNQVVGDFGLRGSAKLTYSMTWRPYPKGSRFIGAWRICVLRAENLPRQDKLQLRTTSDPFCEITAMSDDRSGMLCVRQLTSVKVRTLNPEWGECFELPIVADTGNLASALQRASPGLAISSALSTFPGEKLPRWQTEGPVPELSATKSQSRWSFSAERSETAELEKALESWKQNLDGASATVDDIQLGQEAASDDVKISLQEELRTDVCVEDGQPHLDWSPDDLESEGIRQASSSKENSREMEDPRQVMPVPSRPQLLAQLDIHEEEATSHAWLGGISACGCV